MTKVMPKLYPSHYVSTEIDLPSSESLDTWLKSWRLRELRRKISTVRMYRLFSFPARPYIIQRRILTQEQSARGMKA